MEKEIIEPLSRMIDLKKEEIVQFAMELVKTLSENPPGNETFVADLIKKQAAKWGFPKPEIIAQKDDRPNLVYTLKGL